MFSLLSSRPPLTPPCCLRPLLLLLIYLVNMTLPLTPPHTCLRLQPPQTPVSFLFLPHSTSSRYYRIIRMDVVQTWNESSWLMCAGFLTGVSLSGPGGVHVGDQDLSLGQYWTRLQWDSEQRPKPDHQNEIHQPWLGSGEELRATSRITPGGKSHTFSAPQKKRKEDHCENLSPWTPPPILININI